MSKLKIVGAVLAAGMLSATAWAEDKYWLQAGADNNWSTPENWSEAALPTPEDTALFTNVTSAVCLDVDQTIADLSVDYDCTATLNAGDSSEVTRHLTVTDLLKLQNRGATFEVSGDVDVRTFGTGYVKGTTKVSDGAALTMANANLDDNANQRFVVTGDGSQFTITNLTFYTSAGKNTNVVLEATAESGVAEKPTLWITGATKPLDKIAIRAVNGEFIAQGMVVRAPVDIVCSGAYVDIGDFQPGGNSTSATVPTAITMTGGILRVRSATQIGCSKAPAVLDFYGDAQLQQDTRNYGIQLGSAANPGKLTVKLHPTTDSSETEGVIVARKGNKCNITLAAGVKFEIDCDGLRGFTGTKRMMVMSQTNDVTAASYAIPTADCITLTGDIAPWCTASFAQEANNLVLTIEVGDTKLPIAKNVGNLAFGPDGTITIPYEIVKFGDNATQIDTVYAKIYDENDEQIGNDEEIGWNITEPGSYTGYVKGVDTSRNYWVTVYAVNSEGEGSEETEKRIAYLRENAPVTYTWIGGESGLWYEKDNWDASTNVCVGFPDSSAYATAVFTNANVTVDVGGAGMDVVGLTLPTETLTITNGTISHYDSKNCIFTKANGGQKLVILDGGKFTSSAQSFKQNAYGNVIELAGNASYGGTINSYAYSPSEAGDIGNTLNVHGAGNVIDGMLVNQSGNLFLNVTDGDLTITGNMQAGDNGHAIVTSVSNATVTCKAFTPWSDSTRRAFSIYVPADGFEAAPIKATTLSTLYTNTYATLTLDSAFAGGTIPLIGGIKLDKNVDLDVLATQFTVPAGWDIALTNDSSVLCAKLTQAGPGGQVVPGSFQSEPYADETVAQARVAQINGAKDQFLKAPDGVADTAAYLDLFAAKYALVGEQYVVTVDLTDAAKADLQEQVDGDLEAAAADLIDAAKSEITITTTPGFYYWTLGGIAVDAIETPGEKAFAAGASQTVVKPGLETSDKAFYKIAVDYK